jgi:hydrogenase-4 component E
MSETLYVQLLDLLAGTALVAGIIVLWRRSLEAIIRTLAVQGAAVAGVAVLLGTYERDPERLVAAAAMFAVKTLVVPIVMLRVLRAGTGTREAQPLVNVAASLLASALLTVVAYAVSGRLIGPGSSAATRAMPIGLAVVLIGFFTIVTRRSALAQAVGFLLLDNGVALVALLAATGVPLIVELGVLLDVLLASLVLGVLVGRMHLKFGTTVLHELRELRD